MAATHPASSVSMKVTRWYLHTSERMHEEQGQGEGRGDGACDVEGGGWYLRRVAEMRRLSLARGLWKAFEDRWERT